MHAAFTPSPAQLPKAVCHLVVRRLLLLGTQDPRLHSFITLLMHSALPSTLLPRKDSTITISRRIDALLHNLAPITFCSLWHALLWVSDRAPQSCFHGLLDYQ